MKKLSIFAITLLCPLAIASASITDLAVYHMGEGATLPSGKPVDSIGGLNATNGGNVSQQTANPSPVSTDYAQFLGTSQFNGVYGINWSSMPADNFAIELWLNYDGTAAKNMDIFATDSNGFKLSLSPGGNLRSSFHGVSWVDQTGVPLQSDTWVHLAMVRDSGTLTTYIDGTDSGINTTTGAVTLNAVHIGIQPGGGNNLVGLVDELRIFSFGADDDYVAAFNTVPEPAILALLLSGLLFLAVRRK